MSTYNSEQRAAKLDELLEDKGFVHDLIMGKYGYHPDERTARVSAYIDSLIPEGEGAND
jgi:uncharacterized phage protein gp47/JayE